MYIVCNRCHTQKAEINLSSTITGLYLYCDTCKLVHQEFTLEHSPPKHSVEHIPTKKPRGPRVVFKFE